MEILVGREQHSRRLSITKEGKVQLAGNPGSVPVDVSRNHLSLTPQGANKWKIKNLNDLNVTYVNGVAIESKVVSENDKVELGKSHYLLSWDFIRGPKVETVDFRKLKYVWENYNEENIAIRKRQKNNGLLASIPMLFSTLGGILTTISFVSPTIPPQFRAITLVFTILALILMVYGLYKRFADDSIDRQEEMKKELQRTYVCPKCKHFLGYQDFDLIMQNDACPYCKAKIIK